METLNVEIFSQCIVRGIAFLIKRLTKSVIMSEAVVHYSAASKKYRTLIMDSGVYTKSIYK